MLSSIEASRLMSRVEKMFFFLLGPCRLKGKVESILAGLKIRNLLKFVWNLWSQWRVNVFGTGLKNLSASREILDFACKKEKYIFFK